MKRFGLLLLLAGCVTPLVSAQSLDHVEAGVFADYFRISQTDTNEVGLGARAGFAVGPHVKLEAEMAYDFDRAFTEGFTSTTPGGTVGFQTTNLRVLHGMFGPRFELGHGAIRPFVTVKGGFINFHLDPSSPNFSGFTSSVENLRSDNVNGVLYPGGGIEGHLGPVGLRLDVGDEIYFNHGSHNNLRVAFGPFIRF
ncbi:MAG: hypothetical protein PVS2B2_07760 [Candidatus Acidiferrum sp.]